MICFHKLTYKIDDKFWHFGGYFHVEDELMAIFYYLLTKQSHKNQGNLSI